MWWWQSINSGGGGGTLLYVANRKGRVSIDPFFKGLGKEACAQIETTGMDFAPAYLGATLAHTEADIYIDRFHGMSLLNGAWSRCAAPGPIVGAAPSAGTGCAAAAHSGDASGNACASRTASTGPPDQPCRILHRHAIHSIQLVEFLPRRQVELHVRIIMQLLT